MRALGLFLIACGCVGGCASCAMDTTVETRGGGRVHNIGLMSERQNYLIVSGVVGIVGVLFVGFGEVARDRTPKGPKCPMCNGALSGQPQLCQHCRSELRWVRGEPDPMAPDQFATYQAEWLEENERQEGHQRFREEVSARRRAKAASAGKAVGRAMGTAALAVLGSLGAVVVWAPRAFDSLLKNAAGEGNEIIYRFFQTLVYLGIPGAVVLAIALRR